MAAQPEPEHDGKIGGEEAEQPQESVGAGAEGGGFLLPEQEETKRRGPLPLPLHPAQPRYLLIVQEPGGAVEVGYGGARDSVQDERPVHIGYADVFIFSQYLLEAGPVVDRPELDRKSVV